MISEERLRRAAKLADEALLDSLPAPKDCPDTGSPAFYREMEELVRKSRRRGLQRGLRRAACFLLVLLLGSGVFLGVNAEARETMLGWIRTQSKDSQTYSNEDSLISNDRIVPYTIEIPDGYTLDETTRTPDPDGNYVDFWYVHEDGEEIIDFSYQYNTPNSTGSLSVIDTNAERKEISLHGTTADLYIPLTEAESPTIVWEDPTTGALLSVTATMTVQEVIDLAETVKQVTP